MKEWNKFDEQEIIRKYREYVYEVGAIDAGKGAVIDEEIVEVERKKDFRLRRSEIFRYRCRYFTDAGVLGSKRFVREVFEEIKGLLGSKRERQFVRVIGDAGVYSLKRLQNV
jgi:hypothetical protein